ncbi:MAG: hypothetical protein HC862_26620 [Scytonema sp. RU_4_4]|nr:hypothetical protein [Scytonema sp. RU_4_4]
MLGYAQELVYTLKELMPTQYQKDNLEAMLGLFLEAQGADQTARETFFPQIVVSFLLLDIERLIPLARSCGFDIYFSRCKM